MELTDKTIVPRNITFGISNNPTRHWAGGDAMKTSMIDCLSIFLPEGERFFIRSLKHYLPQIQNEEVRNEIRGYSVQEAFHTREHEDYNRALTVLGYDVVGMEADIKRTLRNDNDAVINLAITCAIEHLTMSFSMVTLANPEILEGAPAPYKRLWIWHAVEELEHSAVSLDVFDEVTAHWPSWKRYGLRISTFNVVLFKMSKMQLRNMAKYAEADGEVIDWRFRMRALWAVYVNPGFMRLGFVNIIKYFLPGYRPKVKSFAHLLKFGRAFIGREIPELAHDSVPLSSK